MLRESHQIIGARDKAKPPISKAQVVRDQCRAIISWKRVKSWAVRRKPVQCCYFCSGLLLKYMPLCKKDAGAMRSTRVSDIREQLSPRWAYPTVRCEVSSCVLASCTSRLQNPVPCAAVLCAAVLTVAGVRTSQVLQDEVRSVEQLGPWDRTIVDSARKAQGDRRASPHFGEGLEHRVQVALSPQCRRTPGLCN